MSYRRACALLAADVLLASVTVATASRTQISPVVHTVTVGREPVALAVDGQTQRVFVANFRSATVSMLDAGSGAVLATTPFIPYPATLAIATTPERVFVASGVTPMNPGRVDVLDARSGRRVRTIGVGRGPHALAVDERSGHVFVANNYGTPASPSVLSRLVAWSRPWLPAWGQQWLARLALPSHANGVVADSVRVLDVVR